MIQEIKTHKPRIMVWSILLLFALVFSSISLLNHALYRTFAWDLGIYSNALWNYAHGHAHTSLMKVHNILSDHFELYLLFFVPFQFILGTYTLLVIQIIALLFGAYGVYFYFKKSTEQKYIPVLAMTAFLCSWGIYSALEFDYHNNVVAAMLVPWFLYYFNIKNYKGAALFFILILIGKENMALWAFFICLGLIIGNSKNKENLKFASIFGLIALFYFFGMVKWVMPALDAGNHEYLHFQFKALGKDFHEAFLCLLTKPIYSFKLLYTNTTKDLIFNNYKTQLHLMVWVSGGFALLFRPKYLVMLLPIYGQKLFNDAPEKWGLCYQYCIEFVPILTIAVFEWCLWVTKNPKKQVILAIFSTFLIGFSSIYTLFNRSTDWFPEEQYNFFKGTHYQANFNVKKVNQALELIPAQASVCAQSEFCPHLAFRDSIFVFPTQNFPCTYMVLNKSKAAYPLNDAQQQAKIKELRDTAHWQQIYDDEALIIVKKR